MANLACMKCIDYVESKHQPINILVFPENMSIYLIIPTFDNVLKIIDFALYIVKHF